GRRGRRRDGERCPRSVRRGRRSVRGNLPNPGAAGGQSPAQAGADPRAMTPISSATRVIALLGDPISHSHSPIIQNAACAAAGVDGVYVAIRTDRERLPALMEALAQGGGGGN